MSDKTGGSAISLDELSVVAVVAMGGITPREGLVLNRPLSFVYARDGHGGFVGSDGPFRDVLGYQHGSGRFRAFAGREFTINLDDGNTYVCKDHWWNGHITGFVSATYGTVDKLRKCYVFTGGACIHPAELAQLRATYTGCVYPYWDYEKVICYDGMRKELYGKIFKQERKIAALLSEVKRKHKLLTAK